MIQTLDSKLKIIVTDTVVRAHIQHSSWFMIFSSPAVMSSVRWYPALTVDPDILYLFCSEFCFAVNSGVCITLILCVCMCVYDELMIFFIPSFWVSTYYNEKSQSLCKNTFRVRLFFWDFDWHSNSLMMETKRGERWVGKAVLKIKFICSSSAPK